MDPLTSMFKKAKSLAKNGVDPYVEGKENYELNNPAIEKRALELSKICKGCPLFKEEPVSFLGVEDERIPELSKKICGDCGCSSPYLLRQYSKTCKKWQE